MITPGLDQELQQLQGVYQLITEFLVTYSFQLVGALLIFLLGLWVASKVSRLVAKQFDKHNIAERVLRVIADVSGHGLRQLGGAVFQAA